MTTLFAWRIRNKEFEWAWNALTELEQYRDITEAFEKEMYRSDSEESALLVAFRQYKALPTGYFDQLCNLPDGKNYRCNFSQEIEKNRRSIILNEGALVLRNHYPFRVLPDFVRILSSTGWSDHSK